MAWTILVEDHQRNISAKLYWNRSSGFWRTDGWTDGRQRRRTVSDHNTSPWAFGSGELKNHVWSLYWYWSTKQICSMGHSKIDFVTRLGISCESSAKQTIHMKCHLIFSVKLKTRGPWWSYIAHLSKQLCILTVEVSAKFTALRFLHKFYSPAPQRPCFFSCIMMAWTEYWKRVTKRTILPLYWNWSSGFWQKDF